MLWSIPITVPWSNQQISDLCLNPHGSPEDGSSLTETVQGSCTQTWLRQWFLLLWKWVAALECVSQWILPQKLYAFPTKSTMYLHVISDIFMITMSPINYFNGHLQFFFFTLLCKYLNKSLKLIILIYGYLICIEIKK